MAEKDFADVVDLIARAISSDGKVAISIDYGSRTGTLQAMLGATLHVVTSDFEMYSLVIGCMNSPGQHRQVQVRGGLETLLTRVKLLWKHVIGLMHDGGGNMEVSGSLLRLRLVPVTTTTDRVLDRPRWQAINDLPDVFDVYCMLHAIMNATKRWTRVVAAHGALDPDPEDDDDDSDPPSIPEAGADRTYPEMRASFHALAKCIRNSQLRRNVWVKVQTTSVEDGGCGRPARMIGAAVEHKFVVDDIELGSMIRECDVIKLLLSQLDNP